MRILLLALSACLLGAPPVWASAISIVAGKVGGTEFGPRAVSGPGAVCAHVRVEATGQTDPPAGKGEKCSDETKIGPNKDEPIIDDKLTGAVGSALKNTVGLKLEKKTDLEVGRSIFYKVDKTDDKPTATEDLFARAAIGSQPTASASQTLTTKDGKTIAEGTVNANAPGRGQFAAGILNDPIVFQADPSTLDPAVDFVLGRALSLQATEPGDLAAAIIEIGQDATTVLDFAIQVTFATITAAQTLTPLACDTSSLGGASSCEEYLNAHVLPFLHWDSTARKLTATSDITLYRMVVPSDGTPMMATFNLAGVASTVPGPPTFSLVALGLGLLACARARRRALTPAGSAVIDEA